MCPHYSCPITGTSLSAVQPTDTVPCMSGPPELSRRMLSFPDQLLKGLLVVYGLLST